MPIPGPDEWCFRIDLWLVNTLTHPQALAMPLLEFELYNAANAQLLAEIEMLHDYWQMLLHENSQEYQSFVTPDDIFTPTCPPWQHQCQYLITICLYGQNATRIKGQTTALG